MSERLDALVAALLGTGRVQVSAAQLTAADDTTAAIAKLDAEARAGCPGVAPTCDPALAGRALRVLVEACQLLVFRDREPGAVPVLAGTGPGAHWSVDLAFRHLPAVHRQARARAVDDPLLPWLEALVRPWPLSAVGITMASPPDPAVILDHPALAAEYLDRCVAAGDGVRLADARVQPRLAAALGGHPELVRFAAVPIKVTA